MKPIKFQVGVNLVVAEIRIPENRNLDTHNLGKTTVGLLIDFCLLKKKNAKFFLFKHTLLFSKLTFYLQILLDDGTYLTICRPVDPGSKASFLRSEEPVDATVVPPENWDAFGVPFERSKVLLDGYLNFHAIKPWPFRKLAGYLLRSQKDYSDIFQLDKFSGKHSDWKPFVASMIGLSASKAINLYENKDAVDESSAKIQTLEAEWPKSAMDPSTLDGLIATKRRDADSLSISLDEADFSDYDAQTSIEISEELDGRIAYLNDRRYQLQQIDSRISESLKDGQIFFRPADANALFSEANIHLGDQVTRSYQQLVDFNLAITAERHEALVSQQSEVQTELQQLDSELANLSKRRSASLSYLKESEAVQKYKALSDDLVQIKSDVLHLESRREAAERMNDLRREHRQLEQDLGQSSDRMAEAIVSASGDESTRFAHIRKYFSEILVTVLGRGAILSARVNKEDSIEFTADFLGSSGLATSEDEGTSYKKLMCIAFDLALLRANLDRPYPRFVFHDGTFESLEKRKRERLMSVLRDYSSLGIQPIVTALDSDLDFESEDAHEHEVMLLLHDEGAEGRLFHCDSW